MPTSKRGQNFKIRKYSDLDQLLEKGWYLRGLTCNTNGNYCYVILSTVDYSLQKLRPLVEFIPVRQEDKFASTVNSGEHLNFVMNYGTASTFGKEKTIFT